MRGMPAPSFGRNRAGGVSTSPGDSGPPAMPSSEHVEQPHDGNGAGGGGRARDAVGVDVGAGVDRRLAVRRHEELADRQLAQQRRPGLAKLISFTAAGNSTIEQILSLQ